MDIDFKLCKNCDEEHDITEFAKDKKSRDG